MIKYSEFVFDYIHLFYYKCLKINLNRGGSYIDSSDWIKKIINPINKKGKCFRYTITEIKKDKEIKKDLERITKIEPFINEYN